MLSKKNSEQFGASFSAYVPLSLIVYIVYMTKSIVLHISNFGKYNIDIILL